MNETPDTTLDAYQRVLDAGDDVTLRRRVAAALMDSPMTTSQLDRRFDDTSLNAIRPRVNELLRRGCIKRDGKRTNPSGNDAYVHRVTPIGEAYVRGEADPEPEPTVTDHRKKVVDVTREYLRGNASRDVLHIAVESHDNAKRREDPRWNEGL